VLTPADWWYLAGVGSVMMVGTLAVLDAYYPGGMFTLFAKETGPNTADETYARSMAFTTLMMFQLFNVYNCRSNTRSAFSGFFKNKWLLLAVIFSLSMHMLVIYVPFLQNAFHTIGLSASDWLIATCVAATLLVVVEAVKLVLRMRHPSPSVAGEAGHGRDSRGGARNPVNRTIGARSQR
jgi:Ca2+-transporting ATPase